MTRTCSNPNHIPILKTEMENNLNNVCIGMIQNLAKFKMLFCPTYGTNKLHAHLQLLCL